MLKHVIVHDLSNAKTYGHPNKNVLSMQQFLLNLVNGSPNNGYTHETFFNAWRLLLLIRDSLHALRKDVKKVVVPCGLSIINIKMLSE